MPKPKGNHYRCHGNYFMTAYRWVVDPTGIYKGNNGRMFNDGYSMYSYGYHFKLARIYPTYGAILIKPRSLCPSKTTAEQRDHLWCRANSSIYTVFEVPHVDISPEAHRMNFDYFFERQYAYEMSILNDIKKQVDRCKQKGRLQNRIPEPYFDTYDLKPDLYSIYPNLYSERFMLDHIYYHLAPMKGNWREIARRFNEEWHGEKPKSRSLTLGELIQNWKDNGYR